MWTRYKEWSQDPPVGLAGETRSPDMFEGALREAQDLLVAKIESKFSQQLLFQSAGDDDFPPRLTVLASEDRPRFLFAMGNIDLLSLPTAGICGSRHASERGMDVARKTVQLLCDKGVTIVSGYAAGVDTMAHQTALEMSGSTIIVLPEGIAHATIRRELKKKWNWKRVLLLSQFSIDTTWKPWNAMLRNRTIMALSDVMLVVEARSTGGTFDAGMVSLKYSKPVFAVDFSNFDEASAGNRTLLERGARPLQKNRHTGEPSISGIWEELRKEHLNSRPKLKVG